LLSSSDVPKTLVDPLKVCVAVKVLATLTTAIFAPARVVAPVPPLAIGSVPVTPVVKGNPVALVKVTLVGVPKIGVTRVGLVENTKLVDVVPVAPDAVYPVMLLKEVMVAVEAPVPPLFTATAVPFHVELVIDPA